MSINGVHNVNGISPDFQWKPEYDTTLLGLANSDYVETDWGTLRDMIKHKLDQNIASYMSDPPPPPTPPSAPAEPQAGSPDSTATTLSPSAVTASSNAKFPPFKKREVDAFTRNEYNSHGRSKTILTDEEARSAKEGIWRLLHDFEGNPPFTIQRICELTVHPRAHYKSLGKYLRAFERALLVTSTIDAFPVLPPEDPSASAMSMSPLHTYSPTGSLREATTPLFSPIPFLHEDARSRSRSRSRSPPMSPLQLGAAGNNSSAAAAMRAMSPGADEFRLSGGGRGAGTGPSAPPGPVASSVAVPDPMPMDALAVAAEGDGGGDGPVIGLVDELDDPSPGHMSDHPTALTSTTSTMPEPAANVTHVVGSNANAGPSVGPSMSMGIGIGAGPSRSMPLRATGRPLFGGSLQDRFVKATPPPSDSSSTSTSASISRLEGEEERGSGPASDDSDAMAVDDDADKENIKH